MKFILSLLLGLSLLTQNSLAAARDPLLQQKMLRAVDTVEDIYRASYAPQEWKQKFAGWSLATEIDRARQSVVANPAMTVRQFQTVMQNFIASTKDYHVGINFNATAAAKLPFVVRGAEGRYFIMYIDRNKLSEESFPYAVGDELVKFGGKAVGDVIAEIKTEMQDRNVAETDQALAELILTFRRASNGMSVPAGPISLEIKPKDSDKSFEVQVIWEVRSEQIGNPFTLIFTAGIANPLKEKTSGMQTWLESKQMVFPQWNNLGSVAGENNYALGTKKSYMPALGTKIWESKDEDIFHAYIFRNTDSKLVGYIRIPSYVTTDYAAAVKEFAGLMTKFQASTDAMVIDQVNNPGGSVFYLYALVSMLTDQAFFSPRHRMMITQADVQESADLLEQLKNVTNDDQAKKIIGDNLSGYPINYTAVNFLRNFANFVLEQWNAGKNFTDAYYLWGADKINPHTTAKYTKPILLLVNSLDFSGGDFFPAILQDNKRVTIMGTRTAGAGGYVNSVSFPNQLGIAGVTLTGSIAERVDLNPIENLGVTPDIQYSTTVNDLQNNYQDYLKAVQTALSNLK